MGALLVHQNLIFLVTTLCYMIICVIYCHQLPFCFLCGGAPHQIQPNFCLIPTKRPRKKNFSSPWWVRLHSLHRCTPWLRLCVKLLKQSSGECLQLARDRQKWRMFMVRYLRLGLLGLGLVLVLLTLVRVSVNPCKH